MPHTVSLQAILLLSSRKGLACLLLPACHGRCWDSQQHLTAPEHMVLHGAEPASLPSDPGAMQSRPLVDLDAANQAVQEQMGSQAWDLAEIERTKLAQV